MGKLIIVPDPVESSFTHSECNCPSCCEMNDMEAEWKTYVPKNHLQRRMIEVVKRIEKKYANKSRKKR